VVIYNRDADGQSTKKEGEPSRMTTTVQRILILAVLVVSVLLVIRSFTAPLPEAAPLSPPGDASAAPPTIDPSHLRLPAEIAALLPSGGAQPSDPDATWVAVAEFNGQDTGRTPTFELSGNLARVRYKVDAEMPVLFVFFVPADHSQPSAFPDVISASQTEGEATISKPAGSYYLAVQTIGGSWTVAVEEEQVL
jgi:hypothetical protein